MKKRISLSGNSFKVNATSPLVIANNCASHHPTYNFDASNPIDNYRDILGNIYNQMQTEITRAMKELFVYLDKSLQFFMKKPNLSDWKQFVETVRNEKAIVEALKEPITFRCSKKPRGYAGDAETLDYLYFGAPMSRDVNVNEMSRHVVSTPTGDSVRDRVNRIAEQIDTISKHMGRRIRVLSIASGHSRELHFSHAYKRKGSIAYYGIDLDKKSLDQARADYPHDTDFYYEHVKKFLKGESAAQANHKKYDFIFSTGLTDCLKDAQCQVLVKQMFDHLSPGGTIMVANFLNPTSSRGYMECVMDWHLIYRSTGQIFNFSKLVPATHSRVEVFTSLEIGYLILTKKNSEIKQTVPLYNKVYSCRDTGSFRSKL